MAEPLLTCWGYISKIQKSFAIQPISIEWKFKDCYVNNIINKIFASNEIPTTTLQKLKFFRKIRCISMCIIAIH